VTVAESGLRSTHIVHAILVTHNGARWLPELARALAANTRRPDSLVAVDTGSQDRSRDLASGVADTVLIAERDEGFGDAVALAVEQLPAPVDGAIEWIWLLHDDFAPGPDALERLLAAVDDAPAVGIAGPKIRGWNDQAHLLEVGVSIAGNGARWTGLDRRERDQGQHDGVHDVLAVSTAGMLVRRDVWEELEGLDPNISLFRDDVDFGWRANVAGHRVICVTDAVGYHAEAAATERRRIDVSGALHRPHLLDRRHAAYVLLANCSPSRLPIVFLRLVLASATRAVGYLLAKLPGYAIDEIGGIALLIARPDLLRKARRARRRRRLLPARTVKRYLAPFGSQTRAMLEGVRNLILRGLDPFLTPTTSTSVLTAEDDEEVPVSEEPLVRRLIARPGVALLLGLTLVALVASRSRFGPLSGGSLLPAPEGARDLWSFYTQSWHTVQLGSGVPSPPWVPLLAFASIITGGNVPLLITALFILAVPASGMVMYTVLRPRVDRHLVAAIGAAIYALSPVIVAAVNGGRLGTLVVALVFPIYLRIIEPLLSYAGLLAASWRRIMVITAISGVLVAFAPVLLLLAVIAIGGWVALHPRESWAYPRILMPVGGAFLLAMPWSARAVIDPLRWLSEPGLTFSGARPLELLTLNPGGPGAPPLWTGGALLGVAVLLMSVAARWSAEWLVTVVGGAAVLLALVLSMPTFAANGSGVANRPWLGSLLLVATACFVMVGVSQGEALVASLQRANFGILQLLVAIVGIALALSLTLGTLWFAWAGSEVRTGREPVLPAFVAELSSTPDQARTLVLDASGSQVRFGILRGRELTLGEADVVSGYPRELVRTVETLLAGANQSTIDRLGRYGIGFILMSQPVDQDLARTLDGVGGLQRLSVTDGRILWSVATTTARVRLIDAAGTVTPLRDDSAPLTFAARTPGIIALAERADESWRAISDGQRLQVVDRGDGLQAFELPKAGDVIITHDDPSERAGLTLAVITAAALIFLIAPSGRRLRERPDEEVA
jgi:GT2 family glycosyltransferase